MNFNWDKKTLIKNRDNLIRFAKKNRYNKFMIDFYNQFLKENDDECEITFESDNSNFTDEQLLDILEQERYQFEGFLSCFPTGLRNNLTVLLESLKFLSICSDDIKLKQKKLSNQDLFDNSYLVYGSISPYFERCLDYIYKHNLVYRVNENNGTSPMCYNDLYNKQGFIYYFNIDDYSSFSCFNHELAHSITTLLNGSFFYEKYPYLAEFHSIFMEMYTDKYMYDTTSDNHYLISLYNSMQSYKSYISNLAVLFELNKINSDLSVSNVVDRLQNGYGIVVDDFNKWGNQFISELDMENHFIYLISCCYALSVLDKDKEDVRRQFIDSQFNDISTFKQFNKVLDINLSDSFYMCDIFNNASCEVKKRIRNIK